MFAQFALFLVIGVMLFTYYQHVPPPALGRADEILPAFVVARPDRRRRRVHRRGDRRRRAVAVAQRDGGGHRQRLLQALLAARRRRCDAAARGAAGDDRLGRRAGRRRASARSGWTDRCSTPGWRCCRWRAVPCSARFWSACSRSRVRTGAMLTGMVAGIVVLIVVWGPARVAWTWYAAIGAGCHERRGRAGAGGLAGPRPGLRHRPACPGSPASKADRRSCRAVADREKMRVRDAW